MIQVWFVRLPLDGFWTELLNWKEPHGLRDLTKMAVNVASVQVTPARLVLEEFERLADAGAVPSPNDERSGEG
ncbi:MAG TPA: hypothetical protein PKD98_25670 [Anaerolineae bacterium]|nr:hypothetical protein [Anaerolineae bacterium]